MIRLAIKSCPENLWDDRTDGTPFWHLSYHTLFYIDFYLSENEKMFKLMEYHQEKSNFLPDDFVGIVTIPEKVYSQEQMLEHSDHCLFKYRETFRELINKHAQGWCSF